LVNAGVRLTADTMAAAMVSPLTWGIVGGLVLGKFIGITGATWLVARLRWGELAPGLTLRRVAGGAALSGIGFTISLFIIDIAIHDPLRQDEARVGVLLASLLAFLLGWAIFRITDWVSPPKPVGLKLVRQVDPDWDHIRGKPDAPLTLVEYGDFECPFCSRATGSIDQVRDHFGDELRYVWRHCRWNGCIRGRSTRRGPARRPRCRAGSGRWPVRCSRIPTISNGRISTATP
jgi:hypothetical protein